MTPLVHLLLAACALAAPLHAASIREPASELQKKIPATFPEGIKQPLETNPEDESAEIQEPVKETENELRVKPAADIPVKVVIEEITPSAVKIDQYAFDDDDVDMQRPADLKNPGLPQRQEHETQNPEQHADEQLKVSTIKENINQAQILLRQSFQDVTSDIQNWLFNKEGQIKIQQNIQTLRDTFTSQIQKLNDTVQALAKPEDTKPAEAQVESLRGNFHEIEFRLKTLKDNFNNGVDTLSAGVNIVANLKSVGEDSDEARQEAAAEPDASTSPAQPAPAQPAPPAQPEPAAQPASSAPAATNPLQAFMDRLSSLTTTGFQNIQNLLTPSSPSSSPPAGAQADQPAGTTSSPPFGGWTLPNWNIPNIFNNSGNFNLPQFPQFPQLTGLFRPGASSTVKPAAAATASGSPAADKPPLEPKPEGQSDKPADSAAASPPVAESATQPNGPIRQIVQGVNNAIQRITNSIANPERPREPVEKSDGILEKGGWYGKPGHSGGSGDNIVSGLTGKNAEEVAGPIQEDSKKEDVKEDIKEEVNLEQISEKTE